MVQVDIIHPNHANVPKLYHLPPLTRTSQLGRLAWYRGSVSVFFAGVVCLYTH
ncbi:hypothetical protein BDZ94DRAFT_985036 [Collybia nuda]|uniref:Uncharacterized protein n=1 Tax=Collybia nuda TaxID=64659 RepID=A0A9P5Y035_9AGAR|nr:hypothetical protein BDZ94DRAFT_985036 [Collybia nuda]